jgi:rhodanese-related sulfurtransferase
MGQASCVVDASLRPSPCDVLAAPLRRASVGGVDLTAQEAAARIDAGQADLVDVREPYEYEAGRIEGARHVPLQELAPLAQELDRERPLIFVCRVGGRSAMAADAFRGAGFDAYNLSGGVLAWQRAGLPFTGVVADH